MDVEGEGIVRTRGEPVTMRTLWDDYGSAIEDACGHLGVDTCLVASMMCIEAVRVRGTMHWDPRSLREEPGYVSDRDTPHRVSPGLMQTLLSTAEDMRVKYGLYPEPQDREDLFVAARSIMLGTAYLAHQIERYGTDDPVLMCGAYNAGSIRSTTKNRWHIRTYGEGRIDKMLAYYNDFRALQNTGEVPR